MNKLSKEELNKYFEGSKPLTLDLGSTICETSTFAQSTLFISRYLRGSDVEQRVFAENCEDVLKYPKDQLESNGVYNEMNGKTLMEEIINDTNYDFYIEKLKSFEGIDFDNFLYVDDLFENGKLYKAIINISPLHQDDNETYWVTFVTDVRTLNFDNTELNNTLGKAGVIFVKTVIKDGFLHTIEDNFVKEYFDLHTSIDDPLAYIEAQLSDPNSSKFQLDYQTIMHCAEGGDDHFEQHFMWTVHGKEYMFNINSVVTARSREEVSLISVISDETKVYYLREKLKDKNTELRYALDLTRSNILTLNHDSPGDIYIDISVVQQLGIHEEDYKYMGNGVYKFNWHQKIRDYFDLTFSELFEVRQSMKHLVDGKVDQFEIILRRNHEKNGEFLTSYFMVVFSKLSSQKFIGVITDITDRHENEIQLYKTQKMFEAASSAGGIGVWYMDLNEDAEYMFCTDTLANMYDMELTPDRRYKRKDWYDRVERTCPADIYEGIRQEAKRALKGISNSYDVIYPFIKEDGSKRWYQEKSSSIERDEFGNATVIPGVTVDVTESVLREEAARKEAITCSLTGLKNRIAFEQGYEIDQYKDKIIYFMDLDDFGIVNTNYSHQHGDEFLRATGLKLDALDDECEAYRIGGDEFMIILDKYDSNFVKRVFEAVRQTVYIDDIGIALTSSLGVIDLKKHEVDSFDDLLSLLSMTMNEAKNLGKNYYVEVDESHMKQFSRNKVLYSNFSKGLKKEYVIPFFQPYIDSRVDKVIGFEALARVQIDGVMYYPNEFIPMLEIGDNIAKLDLIMFEYCCQFGEEIDKMNLIDQVPIYSSNLSTRSIRYLKPEQFIEISDKYDLDRKFIEVEVTEQVLINESGYSMIDELSDLGYNIAVDDFSAGYASLKYVSQMTADTLKIDRALLNDLELDEGARNVIYKAVIDLAKELNLNIVSEGIETKEQAKILKGLDGEIFQGFYCSEPIPKDEFLDYIYKYNMNKE